MSETPRRQRLPGLLLLAAVLVLAACGQSRYVENTEYNDPSRSSQRGSIFGSDAGFTLFGSSTSRDGQDGGGALGVNAFLWRGSLDTLSFMPLVSADPFGGVIITDWYVPPQTPGERFKVTVYILDRTLRADGLRVGVFRQVRQGESWVDQPAAPNTATTMENAILQRAREFRMEAEARR
jgi:hypothetical protein